MKPLKDKIILGSSAYIDMNSQYYFYDDKKVKLSPNDMKIIKCLCTYYDSETVSGKELFKWVYGHEYAPNSTDNIHLITTAIHKLRNKGEYPYEIGQYIVGAGKGTYRIILAESPFDEQFVATPAGDDKDIYLLKYREPFILHRRDCLVSFKDDIYVSPDCDFTTYQDRNSDSSIYIGNYSLLEKMRSLINNNQYPQPNLYLLLGHGASGKSSYVTMITANPHFLLQEGTDFYVLMLRRFSEVKIELLCQEIEKCLPNMSDCSVIILDGLDELCMMRNDMGATNAVTIVQNLCDRILSYNRRIILTSRPGFIDPDEIWQVICNNKNVYGMTVGSIKPFSHHKRIKFVDKLKKADSSLENREECKWICQLNDKDEINEVYSLPFFIYLIAASSKAPSVSQNPITELERNNKWALFRRLFHDIYFDSDYWEIEKTSRTRLEIKEQKEKLYTISCYVAWKMCSGRLGRYFCTSEQIKEIIAKLNFEPELLEEITNFFPVASYINRLGKNNAYEFSHNFVRDFFLCEFFLSQLNMLTNTDSSSLRIIQWAKQFLSPHNLRTTSYGIQSTGGHWVLRFVEDYSAYYYQCNGKNCPYDDIMKYDVSKWNEIFYQLFHNMEDGILSSWGKKENENVFNNLKYAYLSLFPYHDTIVSSINMPSEKQIDKLRTIEKGRKVIFGLNQWYVLDIEGDYIKLISAVGFVKKYHDIQYNSYSINNICWDNCTLRSWLNHTFFVQFFSNSERLAITYKYDTDPVEILDYESVCKLLDATLISRMVSNTLKILEKSLILSQFPSIPFRILAIDGTLKSINLKWDDFMIDTSRDSTKYGLVFPVVHLYYRDLSLLRDEII